MSQSTTRRDFLRVMVLPTGAALLAACTPAGPPAAPVPTAAPAVTAVSTVAAIVTSVPAAATESPRSGAKLVFGRSNDGDGFDPGTNNNSYSWEVQLHMLETLVRAKPDSTEIEPALAERWSVSDDGLTWTFNLRQGVKFHDGTDFNADAAILNIDRQLNGNNQYYWKGRMLNATFLYGAFDSYQAVDPDTVQIKLKRKFAPLLRNLGSPAGAFVSPESLKKYGQDIVRNPVGTGPYKFVEWVAQDHVTLERNPNWWDKPPYLDSVVLRTVPENSVRLAKLQNGELDYIENITPDDIPRIQEDHRLVLKQYPGMGMNGMVMQCQRAPYTDVRVRQALNYAINREEITAFLHKGMAALANSPLPPTIAGYDSSLKPYPFDPQKAKELLSAAGYADGFDAHLLTYTGTIPQNPAGGEKQAAAIQQYLRKVGIRVTIEAIELGGYLTKRRAGDFDLALQGWIGSNGDPNDHLYSLYHTDNLHTTNCCLISDPKLDKMLIDGQTEYDDAQRAQVYKEAQKYIMEIVPWVYINVPTYAMAGTTRARDVALYPVYLKHLTRAWQAA